MRRRGRGTQQPILAREIERGFLKIMPELPRWFKQLARQVENYDGSEPRTFLDRIEAGARPISENFKGRGHRFHWLFRLILRKSTAKILVNMFASQMISIAKRSAATDKRYSLLLTLMHDTDATVRLASFVATYNYANGGAFRYYPDHKAFFVAQATALNYYKQAESASGETRAVLALEALVKTVELVYKPYLTMLWFLSYVKVGRLQPDHLPDLGCILKVTLDRLSAYPGLVEPDAVWMRNAAVHNEPDYILGEDAVWMRDRSHNRTKVRVDDLMALTARMYTISTQTIQWVSCLYMFREVFLKTGLADMMAECLTLELAGNANELKEAEARMTGCATSLFEPLERFLAPITKATPRKNS